MTDLEITKLCAEAFNPKLRQDEQAPNWWRDGNTGIVFDPLRNDAQAMALVKKFRLRIFGAQPPYGLRSHTWIVEFGGNRGEVHNADLNRAICECVAKMRQAKAPA